MRVLAVVPARGGSKGVTLKNLVPLAGKPLIEHTADVIKEIPQLDRAVVSTDHAEIARVAAASGIDAPFTRPAELSGDRVGDADVLVHALLAMEQIDKVTYDIVVMLQPTCPLRSAGHVIATISKLADEGWDAVWTVSPTDLKYHPLKQLKLSSSGQLDFYDAKGASIIARQQLSPVYHRNGACYAITRDTLLDRHEIIGPRSTAVVVHEPLVSIDTLDDFRNVEQLMQTGKGRAQQADAA